MERLSEGRVAIPLVMIEGNMDILLENTIRCTGISLKRIISDEFSGQAVVLTIHDRDKEQCAELGFQTRPVG
jgi:hypothetical protein